MLWRKLATEGNEMVSLGLQLLWGVEKIVFSVTMLLSSRSQNRNGDYMEEVLAGPVDLMSLV